MRCPPVRVLREPGVCQCNWPIPPGGSFTSSRRARCRLVPEPRFLEPPTMLWRSATLFADTSGMRDLVRSGQYVDMDTLVGAIVHSDGTAKTVGRPRGVSHMTNPLAVPGPNGSVDAVWMTKKDSTKQFTDLWFARYSASGWSEPEHVLHGHYFQWSTNSGSAVAGDGHPIVAITGTEDDSAPRTGIGIVRRVGTDWKVTWIPTGALWPFRVKRRAS